ncbi:MAG: hypothetical protein HY791_05190 [Deltaproteobacteria bacterium]|nr:hypothetical protein [Deltaproteobacteria bacterium]
MEIATDPSRHAAALPFLCAISCAPSGFILAPELPDGAPSIVALVIGSDSIRAQAQDSSRLDRPLKLERTDDEPTIVIGAFAVPLEDLGLEEGPLEVSSVEGWPLLEPLVAHSFDATSSTWVPLDGWPPVVKKVRFRAHSTSPTDLSIRGVSAGSLFTCANRADGAAFCWGHNLTGELGRADPISAAPGRVEGIGPVSQLSAGEDFVCALETSGKVRCWGKGDAGQLGGGVLTTTSEPTLVELDEAVAIESSSNHACALDARGRVLCWGSDAAGAVGTGEGKSISKPFVVSVGPARRVVVGHEFTCALLLSGEVWCWGANRSMELGKSPAGPAPTLVLSDAIELAAGHAHACARLSSGDLHCWGGNEAGQLGRDTQGSPATPGSSALSSAQGRLLAGPAVTCVAEADREPRCGGVLLPGTPNPTLGPIRGKLARGFEHACAVSSEGHVSCWGWNGYGQVGTSTVALQVSPVQIPGLADVERVWAGFDNTCVRTSSGQLSCFGKNRFQGFVDSTDRSWSTPRSMSATFDELSFGSGHTCVRVGGTLGCFGSNSGGQLGVPSVSFSETLVPIAAAAGGHGVTAGPQNTCAILADHRLACWGWNGYFQVGDGKETTAFEPVPILPDMESAGIGDVHTCALAKSGDVLCWGYNNSGQLGLGRLGSSVQPARVELPGPAVELAVGARHTCVRLADRSVYCSGINDDGMLGDGTQARRTAPTRVLEINDARALALGEKHSCILHESGEVSCFGSNAFGQLGNGRRGGSSHSPAKVPGVSDAVSISAGRAHTCVVSRSGRLSCWGFDSRGQLGIGSRTFFDTPVRVPGLDE